MSLDLKTLQQEVDDWIKNNGGYWHPLSILAQSQEELGELAREINSRYGGRVRKSPDEVYDIGEEICDVIFALVCMANYHNIDLQEYWTQTIGARCERDKNRYK